MKTSPPQCGSGQDARCGGIFVTFEGGHLSLSVLAERTNEHGSKTNEKLEYLPALGENPVKKPAGRLGNDRKTEPESSENGEKCKNILKNKIKKC